MPTQSASAKAVFEHVLDPMQAFYDPPSGAASNEERRVHILSVYVEKLSGYSDATLRRAYEAATNKHDRWTWPLPSQFLRECEAIGGKRNPGPLAPVTIARPLGMSAEEWEKGKKARLDALYGPDPGDAA